jgi:hypothetical protein
VTALATARAVLAWCLYPAGPPPLGPLAQAHRLAAPDVATRESVAALARATAARLGAGPVPLGDPGPAGLGPVLLAAFAGGRLERDLADQVLAAAPRLRLGRRDAGWTDALARHGVVAPVVARLGDGDARSADQLLAASPLSGVLCRPAPEGEAPAFVTAMRLLARPRGPAVLTAALAAPEPDPAVLTWRGKLLDHLRQERPEVMLDVYVTARLWSGPAWDDLVDQARRELSGRGRPGNLAIATLRYWLPLDTVHAREQEDRLTPGGAAVSAPGHTLEGRLLLRYDDYAPALRLVGRHRRSLLVRSS